MAAAATGARCPRLLVHEAEGVLATTGSSDPLTVEETIVHASVNQTTETKLSDWLTSWLDRQPSFDVKIRNRRTRKRPIYCKACGATATNCPSCQAPLQAAVEKVSTRPWSQTCCHWRGSERTTWRSLCLETPTIFRRSSTSKRKVLKLSMPRGGRRGTSYGPRAGEASTSMD